MVYISREKKGINSKQGSFAWWIEKVNILVYTQKEITEAFNHESDMIESVIGEHDLVSNLY